MYRVNKKGLIEKRSDLFGNEKYFFYSKKTNELLIELEDFGNVFVYWTYEPNKIDKKLFDELGYVGSEEISKEEGLEMLIQQQIQN